MHVCVCAVDCVATTGGATTDPVLGGVWADRRQGNIIQFI